MLLCVGKCQRVGLLVMFMHKLIILSFLASLTLQASAADHVATSPQLGELATPEFINRWNISIFPNGEGLPSGEGTVTQGQVLYKSHCKICHGPQGIGGSAEELAGGEQGLTGDYPDKTIGTYWPFATSIFDFIQRSMPLSAPGSLTADETYALTAYLLYLNNILPDDAVLSDKNLPQVQMPNRTGMIPSYSNDRAE